MEKKNNTILNGKDGSNHSNLADNAIKMETDEDKRARIRSLWVMNIETFIFGLSFSIVITGVLPYLRQVILVYIYKVDLKFYADFQYHLTCKRYLSIIYSYYQAIPKKKFYGNTVQLLQSIL